MAELAIVDRGGDMDSSEQTDRNGGPPAEIELKLTGETKALKRLFADPLIAGQAVDDGQSKRLNAVYYDTPEQQLRAAGLAFRVRKEGRRYVQSLKAGEGSGALLHRGEWQAVARSATPDLTLLPPEAGQVLNGLDPSSLQSIFTTRVRRQVRRIKAGPEGGSQSLIEAALDLGAIESNGQTLPLAEVELELLEGSGDAVYQLALDLGARGPIRVETRSKALRGYTLASGKPPPYEKAASLALDRDTSVDQAMRTIFQACMHHWCANEATAVDGRDPEGVHQMRVALRRLRSAFSVFGRLLDPERRAELSGDAKTIVSGLGLARDWDVFRTELLAPVIAARPDDPHLKTLLEQAERETARAYEKVRATIAGPEYTRTMLELGRWIEAAGWREGATDKGVKWLDRPIVAFADRLLGRRHRKALRLGRGLETLPAEDRHKLRIALKKLRYATEFFQDLYRRKHTAPFLKTLKTFQDDLGHMNDVAVAERLLAMLRAHSRSRAAKEALPMASGLVLGWHTRGLVEIERDLVDAWQDFTHRKPFWH